MVVKGLSWFRQMELGFTPTFQLASCASVAAMGSCQSDLLQQSACCKRVVNPQNSAQLCPSLRMAAPSYDWVPLVWKAEPIFSHRKILSWAVFALGLPHWLAGTQSCMPSEALASPSSSPSHFTGVRSAGASRLTPALSFSTWLVPSKSPAL